MVLVYADDDLPTTVYRLQDAGGHGPYSANWYIDSISSMEKSGRTKAQPSPHLDFDKDEYYLYLDSLHGYGGRVWFGFEYPDDAWRWFGHMRGELEANGYRVTPVLARRVWRSKSGRQVLFEPWPGEAPCKTCGPGPRIEKTGKSGIVLGRRPEVRVRRHLRQA